MTATSFFQNPGTKITLKLALIFILIIFLLIPKFMVQDLVEERRMLSQSVIEEVSIGWGNEQIVAGPVLVIPYNEMIAQTDIKLPKIIVKKNLIVYPENIDANGKITTESKHRSLYNVLLYKSTMNFKGSFVIPDPAATNIKKEDLLLDQAYIIVGLTDPKGIDNKINFVWTDNSTALSPGLVDVQFGLQQDFKNPQNIGYNAADGQYVQGFKTGLHAKIPIQEDKKEYDFSFNLDVKGSKSLMFAPLGKTTSVHLASTFADPIFTGGFLPEHKTSTTGFDASWKILEYNKSLPPFQKDNDQIDLGSNLFGLKIQHLVDNYTTTFRAAKYMVLFITLTFLVVFLTEVVRKIHIHIFQYTLIGLALAIFFTLLLSISEFWGFDLAYIIAATATIGLIFLYSLGMFRNKKSSMLLLGLMTALFGYIYTIIQLEKTALLVGSIGLFIIIAITMYVTRKIKWSEENSVNVPTGQTESPDEN